MIIVEVAMEIAYSRELLQKIKDAHGESAARSCAMSNSVGGIGPLLKERIPAQADLGAEVIGVSLLYDNVWNQGFYQWGQIYIEKKKVGQYLRKVLEDTGIKFTLTTPAGESCEVHVRKTLLHKASVYLLDSPKIANVVYPSPEDAPADHPHPKDWAEEQRFKQSWLVGRGTLELLKHLNKAPDFIVQSETPTFFSNHFLIQDHFQKDPFFKNTKYVFNDHTPLEYAHPFWHESQIKKAAIDPAYVKDKIYWDEPRKGMDVTRLLVGVSKGVYGVSKKHERVMKAMPSLHEFRDKITSITNGVSVPDWRHPDYDNFEKISDDELIQIKERRKLDLIEWIWKRYRLWVDWRMKVQGKCCVLWTRRITSYKRFDVLDRLLKDPELKRRFLQTEMAVLVGGRIHQNDDLSQNVIFNLLDLVTRDGDLKDRVIVLDNYNIWDAPMLFHGVDATIMLADDGREASATGFMKAQVNGAAVIASNDGAVPESVHFDGENPNGFEVPYVNAQPQPQGLMDAFERLDKAYKNPPLRARIIRSALRAAGQVSIDRTAQEMIEFYDILQKA